MTARPGPSARRGADPHLTTVVCTLHGRQLAVLLTPAGAGRWGLPVAPLAPGSVDDAGLRAAQRALGAPPSWCEQIGAVTGPSGVAIGIVAVTPPNAKVLPGGAAWHPVDALPPLAAAQRALVERALATLRARMDGAPIAFRLLPNTFTLSELQDAYEVLLGHRVHKASFRRSLQGAWLVAPTDEWRSEGRGRPAQLFRYAPRKRRGGRRAVRFDLLGG
jgi:8-oxo-dGTP diphosphatase